MKSIFSKLFFKCYVGCYLDIDVEVTAIYLRNQPSIQGVNPVQVHI